jgi:RNA polymerase sporulation-specific sigma factor
MSDEEVIALFREQGEVGAQDYILEKYKRLVIICTRRLYILGGDSEDVIQEGMIGLYKAIRDYDPSKNAKFFTFAKMCIDRQVATAIKTANRQKHKPLNESYSLDKSVFDEGDDFTYMDTYKDRSIVSPENLIIDNENKRSLELAIEDKLSALEKRVLSLYLKGKTYTEIAKIIGREDKSIDNTLQRIKRKVEKIVEERRNK